MEGNSVPQKNVDQNNYYDRCLNAINQSEKDFNKTLTYIVSGAFTISVYFVKNIENHVQFNYLLVLAWISFAVALVINFSSHLYSIGTISKTMDIEDEYKRYQYVEKTNSKIMNINIASLVFSVWGITFLLIFMAKTA